MLFLALILNSLGSVYIYFMIFENLNTKGFKFENIVLGDGVRQRTMKLLPIHLFCLAILLKIYESGWSLYEALRWRQR
jgi:hypothetical protein